MNITEDGRRRFVREQRLPIQVLQSPQFEYLLDLFEPEFRARTSWDEYMEEIGRFGSEQTFNEASNRLISEVREAIESLPQWDAFIADTMRAYSDGPNPYQRDSIYHAQNLDRSIISVDMVKANFQSLRFYDPALVFDHTRYEDLMRQFTDCDYFVRSKQIRQVIFGKLAPERQQTVQKHLLRRMMNAVAAALPVTPMWVSSDEFIFVANGRLRHENGGHEGVIAITNKAVRDALPQIKTRVEAFRISRLGPPELAFFVRETPEGEFDSFRCVPMHFMAQAVRFRRGEQPLPEDLAFTFEKHLARFAEPVLRAA